MGSVLRREDFAKTTTFSFSDIEREAEAILQRAHAQAARIIEKANTHIQEATNKQLREGFEKGQVEGRQAGFEEAVKEGRATAVQNASAELAQLTQALGQGLGALDKQKRSLLAQAESGLVELALEIARRVCKTAIGESTDVARANARSLLEMIQHRHDLEIHLNPAECELLPADVPELVGLTEDLSHMSIVPDGSVPRGGCVLKGRDGEIDASIDRQLDRIAEAICTGSAAGGDGGSA